MQNLKGTRRMGMVCIHSQTLD